MRLEERLDRLERRVSALEGREGSEVTPSPERPPVPPGEPAPAPEIWHEITDGVHYFQAGGEAWWVNSSPNWTNEPAGEWLRPGGIAFEVDAAYQPLELGHPPWAEQFLAKDRKSVLPKVWWPQADRSLNGSHGGWCVGPHYHWRLAFPDGVYLAEQEMLRVWRWSGIMMLEVDGEPVTSLDHKYSWALPQGPWGVQLMPSGAAGEVWQEDYSPRFELTHFLRQWRGAEMMARCGSVLGKWLIKQTWADCLRWLVNEHGRDATAGWWDWSESIRREIGGFDRNRGWERAGRGFYHLCLILRAFEHHWPGDPLLYVNGKSCMRWKEEFRDVLKSVIRPNGTCHRDDTPPKKAGLEPPVIFLFQQDLIASQYPWLGLHDEFGAFRAWRDDWNVDQDDPAWVTDRGALSMWDETPSPHPRFAGKAYRSLTDGITRDTTGPGGPTWDTLDANPAYGLWT